MALPAIAAFAATPVGKQVVSSVVSSVTGLLGGLFKGHSNWYYTRQHMYGWSINVSGSKANEFGSDVWGMYRNDLKAAIANALQGKESEMDSANGIPWYHVAKAALPYQSQYFNIPADDQLIQIACDLLYHGVLPDKNMNVQPPDYGDKYNTSWVKYQIDTVSANNQLRQTKYWKDNYEKKAVVSTVNQAVQQASTKLAAVTLEPVKDENGKTVTDENGVIQYKTKTSVWVIVGIVASCIICLGFLASMFRKKKR